MRYHSGVSHRSGTGEPAQVPVAAAAQVTIGVMRLVATT